MSAAMPKELRARFVRARLNADTAVLVDRRAICNGDATLIQCDGWLVDAASPTERVGGMLVYVDQRSDKSTFWHRYYCGEEHNPNRIVLGRGLVGWAISAERVRMLRANVAELAKGGAA